VTEFDRGYLYGLVGACLVFLLWDVVDAFITNPPRNLTKLVVLDRRDMKDNANDRASDRMAGSGEVNPNP